MAILMPTIQACVLSVTSNLLAQAIQHYQADTSFTVNTRPILQFILFTVLSTPPNILWQEFLEDLLPGTYNPPKQSPSSKGHLDQEKDNGTVSSTPLAGPKEKLNVKNTVLKILLDQSIGGALNTLAFVTYIAALKASSIGLTNARVWQFVALNLEEHFMSMFLAGLKFWPLVAVVNFTMVPVEKRVLVGSAFGVAWGVYLALAAAG